MDKAARSEPAAYLGHDASSSIVDPGRGRRYRLYEELLAAPGHAAAPPGTREGIGDEIRRRENGGLAWNRTGDLSLIRTAL